MQNARLFLVFSAVLFGYIYCYLIFFKICFIILYYKKDKIWKVEISSVHEQYTVFADEKQSISHLVNHWLEVVVNILYIM